MRALLAYVLCQVCGGTGRWHSADGSECTSQPCSKATTRCHYCEGTGRQ